MIFGLTPKNWAIIKNLVLEPLHNISAQVLVFGSRARGDYKPFSDLDLLIRGEVERSLISRIQEDLENSDLPIKVDLVLEKSLAESYKENVLKDCVLVHK